MSEDRIPTVSTRMSLKIHEQKLKSMQKGFSLLKCKSDALQLKYKELEDKVKEKEQGVQKLFRIAFLALEEAGMHGYDHYIFKKICLETKTQLCCNMEQTCGIPLVLFSLKTLEFNKEILWKGGHKLKETKRMFDLLIKELVELSSDKNNLLAIKETFENTCKRKNSLEHKMIPCLQNTVSYIESELDESEREEFYRLKKVQALKRY